MIRKTNLFLIAAALISTSAFASSRVIRDNRLDDLGITPSLGRGYSIATNTYQSICMGDVEVTIPSYDLKYRYTEIEQDWENEYRVSVDKKTSLQYLFLKGNVDVFSEVEGNSTYHYHYIFARIDVDSYYNSLDEGKSKLSESASSLLSKGDTVGFFDSCGPYYVRSIGRHSSFLALLSYRTTSSERDVNFELKLKAKMRGFFSGAETSTEIETEFRTETQTKRLNISIWGYGLGKDHLADLIPTDIDSFKKTVEGAIKTMQDASTGRVTTIEVVPWIENTEFQNTLKLESEEDVLQFQQKKNLEANSELIAELDRIDRAQIDQYYKALNCRRVLTESYLDIEGDFGYDPENTFFKDLYSPGNLAKEVTLANLDSIVSEEKVSNLRAINDEFLSGDGEETGAITCMNQLFEQGIQDVHFRDIPACVSSRAYSVPVDPVLDHYCLPELSRVIETEITN